MKHLFSAVLLMLCTITAVAQDYYDDYGYDVAEDVYLTGNQWHTDGYSYLEADNNRFLIVAGNTRFYRTLYRPDVAGLQVRLGDVVISYRPLFHAGYLGWYIVGRLRNYFIYPDGRWCCLSFRPVYYDYHYNICGLRHINFYRWHFWSGRHHHRYHGTCYRPPVHRPRHHAPAYRQHYVPPVRHYDNGHRRRYMDNQPRRTPERTAPARRSVGQRNNTPNYRSSEPRSSYHRETGIRKDRGQRQGESRSERSRNSSRHDRGGRH